MVPDSYVRQQATRRVRFRAALGVLVLVGATTLGAARPSDSPPLDSPPPDDDPGVQAFLEAYGPLIDSVSYEGGDVVFAMGERAIHFQGGRMLEDGRLDRTDECDPIFYRYPLGQLKEPLPLPDDDPRYCTDVMESLWGRTEGEIRRHGRPVVFLDHRMFVNTLLVEPLRAVEEEILAAARYDADVQGWIDGLDITYSFVDRGIAGSPTRSQHAWGMAVDFVPSSYGGRAVYWRWSQALDEEGWSRIPIAQRWTPPVPVIEIFERHGFIWGGKWPHFDNIHFEYRPEILAYNRIVAGEQSHTAG